jgi:hypothetical protein
MADLDRSCCSPTVQAACCEPGDKAACCGEHHGDGCGCASEQTPPIDVRDIRETVREKYAAAAGEAAAEEIPETGVKASLGCGVPTPPKPICKPGPAASRAPSPRPNSASSSPPQDSLASNFEKPTGFTLTPPL